MLELKTDKMKQVEEQFNALLELLLPSLFERLGSHRKVAAELGINRHTLYVWCRTLRISTERSTTVVNDDSFGQRPDSK